MLESKSLEVVPDSQEEDECTRENMELHSLNSEGQDEFSDGCSENFDIDDDDDYRDDYTHSTKLTNVTSFIFNVTLIFCLETFKI